MQWLQDVRIQIGVSVQVALGLGQYGEDHTEEIYRDLVNHMEEVPGVRSVALTGALPLMPAGSGFSRRRVQPDGGESQRVLYTRISPGYFDTLGVTLLQGRDLEVTDGPASPGVAVVNEAAAQRFWPGLTILGQRLRLGEEGPWVEVVGVARDGRYASLGESEPPPFIYLAQAQHPSADLALVIATHEGGRAMLPRIRQAIRAFDPDLPVYDFKTLEQHLDLSLFPPRFFAGLFFACALLGLVLAAAGLFGVVACTVSRRTREVGIRMAIGAGARDVVRLIVVQSMTVVMVGMAAGLVLAWAGSVRVRDWLYGVGPHDAWAYLAALAVLTAVALLASLIPARRATRVEPTDALRTI